MTSLTLSPSAIKQNLLAFLIPIVLLVAGLWSVAGVDARDSGDLGLIEAMPVLYFAIVGALGVSFVLQVRRSAPTFALAAHVVALVMLLHGIAAFIEQNPRFPTAYTHIGFIEYMLRHNAALPELDARMSWPGFFATGALLSRVAGADVFTFLLWASVVINLAYAPLIWSIARSATDDRRIPWLATWLFVTTSWVGQDYFAPQAVNFIIFLTFVAIMLRIFRTDDAPYPRFLRGIANILSAGVKKVLRVKTLKPGGDAVLPLTPSERALAVAAMLVMYAACTVSHQLTPVFLLLNVCLLALFRRTELRGFPMLLAISVFTWISYGAVGFWSGHLNEIFPDLDPVKVVQENIFDRAKPAAPPDPTELPGVEIEKVPNDHALVVYVRLLLSAGVWGLATFGILRRLRAGKTDVSLMVLMFGPFLILGGQSYGGEGILRVFFFTLPFAATLCALALLPAGQAMSKFKTALACVVVIVLVPTFTITRWGNERFEYISKNEYVAARELYRVAPLGSTLAQFNPNSPWQIRTKDLYDYRGNVRSNATADQVWEEVADRKDRDAYLYMSRSQVAAKVFEQNYPRNWGDDMAKRLVDSGRFRIIYQNEDAKVFQAVK